MISRFFRPQLYVQLSRELLSVRDPKRAVAVSGPAQLALRRTGTKTTIVAVGQSAQAALVSEPGLQLVRPFAHPRSLLSDFVIAELLLKAFIYELRGMRWFQLAPQIVMHPLGEIEGGLTQIECRALRDLGLGAGASEVLLWQGRSLSDAELLEGSFRTEPGLLD
jgi:rod shape-determining protein MreB